MIKPETIIRMNEGTALSVKEPVHGIAQKIAAADKKDTVWIEVTVIGCRPVQVKQLQPDEPMSEADSYPTENFELETTINLKRILFYHKA